MKKTGLLFLSLFTCALGLLAQERVILQDDFTANVNGWVEVADARAQASIGGGQFKMEHRRAEGVQVFLADPLPLDLAQDFEVSTQLVQNLGGQNDGYGLVCGATDENNYISFTINAAGQYRIIQYKGGNLTELRAFTQAKSPIQPVGKKNRLGVRKKSSLLSFYLNDRFVYSMPYQGYGGARVGYVLYNKMEIAATELTVRQGAPMPEMYEDIFQDNRNNWIVNKEDSNKCVFARGKLVMRGVKPGAQTTKFRENLLNTERDFEIEVNMKQIAGSQEKAYGLMWGAKDSDNGFQFLINSFGAFAVVKREGGREQSLLPWTPSDQVLHLRVTPNKLSIRKSGLQYAFFLNDLWLANLPFQPFLGHQMGFVLSDDIRAEVEYMVVREGEKSITPEAPVITVLSPASGGNTIDSRRVNFQAGISSKSKLKGLKLVLNGEQLSIQAAKDPSGKYDLLVEQEIALKNGLNEIVLSAKNEDGMIQKAVATVTVQTPETPVARNGADYALFFATDEYMQWSDLTNPVNDARTIAQELETNYGFNTELVIDASQKDILSKLKEYARKVYQDGDQLMVFFAGHGKFDEYFGEGYVVCTDSEKDDDGNKSYISHSSLRTIINNIPCKHTFLVMDVCFGGTIDPFIASSSHRGGNDIPNEISHEDFVERKLKFKTRKYLTSGGKEYVPDGAPGAHSPFARKFLEAMRNYGGHDRILTLAELVLYFERTMPEPRFGEFGGNEPGSDFLFIAR